jgi:hypothetical protein
VSEADFLKLALALIGALIGLLYGAVQWEIRKLRKQGHVHGNRLSEHAMAITVLFQKAGIDFKPRGGDE